MAEQKGIVIAVSTAATLALCLLSQTAAARQLPSILPGPDGIIVAIGKQDRSYQDFPSEEFTGVHEYECIVGMDCDTAEFPNILYDMDSFYSNDNAGVAEARIRFNLKNDTGDLTLRLARGGSETVVVQVDEQPHVELAASDFEPPSRDGFGVGVYDVSIGALGTGEHVIKLSMKPGTGDGMFGWDAIILRAGDFDD